MISSVAWAHRLGAFSSAFGAEGTSTDFLLGRSGLLAITWSQGPDDYLVGSHAPSLICRQALHHPSTQICVASDLALPTCLSLDSCGPGRGQGVQRDLAWRARLGFQVCTVGALNSTQLTGSVALLTKTCPQWHPRAFSLWPLLHSPLLRASYRPPGCVCAAVLASLMGAHSREALMGLLATPTPGPYGDVEARKRKGPAENHSDSVGWWSLEPRSVGSQPMFLLCSHTYVCTRV